VIYASGAEVRKGRFSVLGDLLYLSAQAGTGEQSGLVSKADLGLQQFLGEFFASYRLIEGSHGWLDLLAGFRYTWASKWAYRLTTWQSVPLAPSWRINSLTN
jgi:hypothetical protein